ncbi:Nuclear transport factor 2 [Fusarium kuroshium]|uniref:Nuclear transport factor 2 n=2 Tax=Fusarium solani species complex TaxID=232080 RepID=A0A3M2S0M9_9HYPO|nr:Nuclear transport factor 2 [Fusarium kuroshium]RSL80205.1 Nuclear transport factor 2 [Fusarium floridanum]
MAGNFEDVAKQFIEFYYNSFDSDRKSLAALYRPESMLTFESASVLGAESIIEKLSSLPFEKVKHQVSTLDAQPSNGEGGIIILITGALLVDEEQRPMNFSQSFQLARDATGQYFVYNDIFKLVFG